MANKNKVQYGLDEEVVQEPAPIKVNRASMKKRVKKTQGKAKWMGFFYLIGTIAMLGFTFLNLVELTNAETNAPWAITALNFFRPFMEKMQLKMTVHMLCVVPLAVVYALLLLALVINVLRSFAKLGWLYKKKASKRYGFNRNAFAMEDMGRIYSESFCAVLLVIFAFYLTGGKITMFGYIAAGVGLFIHLWCGLVSGNVSLFAVQNGVGVVEQKRKYGRFSPFVRNILQLAAIVGMAFFFAKITVLYSTVQSFTVEGGLNAFIKDVNKIVPVAIEVVALICYVVLVKHATSNSEFDRDGKKAAGRKRFVWFSLFVFLCMGGLFAFKYFMLKETVIKSHLNLIYLAAIALGAFICELIFIACPRLKKAYRTAKGKDATANAATATNASCAACANAGYAQQGAANSSEQVPVQLFTHPCVISQGGEQYMVMPMDMNTSDFVAPPVEPTFEYYFVDEQEGV
ncbi:MAG: hypothetical protein IJB97_05190 [Clostridia bacterium]|nr:hypothetical protein [Clostridia bacterium]